MQDTTGPAATPADGTGPIPLCVPHLAGREWQYLKECLDTGWVSSVGPFVDRFERLTAERLGARGAVATVNGTAALHVALRLAGVGPGDAVLVSDLTFIAPANAVRYLGAWPVFIGAEPRYWQMDADRVRDFLERECTWRDGALHTSAGGRRVRAVVPVHILGHPCDTDPIRELCQKYGLALVEDATESLGATYRGRPVGRLGDIACLSFNGNKLITTGGGGMIVTDNDEWAAKARYLTTQAKDDPIEYAHNEVGYNYRLTNLQAAVGVAQLEQLDQFLAVKRRIAERYERELGGVAGLTTMEQAPWAASAFWMYTVLIDEGRFGADSRALLRRLREGGIESRPLWQPMHLSRAHAGCPAYRCETSADLYRRALSLPCSVGLSDEGQGRVIAAVRAVNRGAGAR
jgi:perosamine synthetase